MNHPPTIRNVNWHASPLGVLTILLVTWSASPADAQTLYVDDGPGQTCPCEPASVNDPLCGTSAQPYSCIQNALDTTKAHDTILVRDGLYNEGVAIFNGGTDDTHRLTIEAENLHGATIAPPSNYNGVFIMANYVTIKKFRINGGGNGVYIWGADQGMTNRGTGNVIEDVEIFGTGQGVRLDHNCKDTRLTRVDVHDTVY